MATKQKLILDDDQQFALMKFRRNIKDLIKPHHNDAFLLRWLRARNWNVEAAEEMFRVSMNWREQWEVDKGLKTWVVPEVLSLYVPCGISGFDRDGAPVAVVPIKGFDIVGVLHSISRQDMVRFTIQFLENALELSNQRGNTDLVVIFDLEEFSIKPYSWRPATEVVISLLQMYEANYPEILKICYVINAPRVFSIAFNVIKRFLNDYTISKIKIFKSDPTKWQKAIKENIDDKDIPLHYGGTLVDPDGNPKCPSKIKQGGIVPKSYYKKNFGADSEDFVQTTIKKGGKITLDFIVADDGRFLKWDFRTEGHDIRFGITCKDEDGNTHASVRHKRVASHQVEVSGVLACNKYPATYTVTFDNSYSFFKSKKIFYKVVVTEPISSLEITTLPEKEKDCEEN